MALKKIFDKVTRVQGGIQNLSIDYTTDPNGRILSMTYTETGGYSGELFYTFDSFGNTTTLTGTQGNVIVGYIYDLNNGYIESEYNPQGVDNPFGFRGGLSIENLTLASNGKDFMILNNLGAIRGNGNLADITWSQPPGTGFLPIEFCPCPEFSLGTERQFSADEIKETYEKAGGGEAGVRAVLELLFGDQLDVIPKAELDALINALSNDNWVNKLLDSLTTHGSQFVYLGGFESVDIAGLTWCTYWYATSEIKYTPKEILEMISEGIAGGGTGIRSYGFHQYRRYIKLVKP